MINMAVMDDTHMASMEIVQFPRLPVPLIHLRPKFFQPLDLGRPISNEPPHPPPHTPRPPSPNDNQSIKTKNNPRTTIMLSGPSFR